MVEELKNHGLLETMFTGIFTWRTDPQLLTWRMLHFPVVLFKGTCSLKIHCTEKDKRSLLNFKQGLIDPSNKLSTWSIEPDCCGWTGVKCDNFTSRVTNLSLPCFTTFPTSSDKVDKSHRLTGSIHLISLLELEFLNYLNLRNNDFLSIRFNSINSHQYNCPNPSVSKYVNSSVLHHLDLSTMRILSLIIFNGFPELPPWNISTLVALIFTR